ncbi:thiamine phosphate synthase [Mucilaginibacter sp. PAMB04168]|uniref:thiamine phosphate synthase n=1 Tax=Mucilaginibacter sp. PAMB04168 TaxID=3138567 RepID=UPI0031F67E74
MMKKKFKITGGVYLVLDPAMPESLLLQKLEAALHGGLSALQIWNNWTEGTDKFKLIEAIAALCSPYDVPLFINEDWQLLMTTSFIDGVHFDTIPANYNSIIASVGRPFMAGITCSGDLDTVRWANEQQLDYVSFCAMFPSPSAGTCDIVMPATVRHARSITTIPIFVSGGITPSNLVTLKKETPFDGVAVISGILSADEPQQQVQTYKDALGINNQ